ncbi:MAG: glycosyltransferase family 4 protein [Acidimicrobiia bacterium]
MRIAQIAPVWYPVPPQGYGGSELIVSLLTEGLVARGHDVTLFTVGGSTTSAKMVEVLPEAPDPSVLGTPWYNACWYEMHQAAAAMLATEGFDVVHSHTHLAPLLGAMRPDPPLVHTVHVPWNDEARATYRLIADRINVVAISQASRNCFPDGNFADVVYNGIDVGQYRYQAEKNGSLVFIGRANPDKGVLPALRIARAVDAPITLICKRSEQHEIDYWNAEIAPLLGSDVEVLQDVDHETKVDRLANASAFVFPLQWDEPFGLVMVEAMACGTPAVVRPFGAAPELVADGVSGFVRDSFDDLVDATRRVLHGEIDPAICRKRVDEHFSAEVMVQGYEALFERVTASA